MYGELGELLKLPTVEGIAEPTLIEKLSQSMCAFIGKEAAMIANRIVGEKIKDCVPRLDFKAYSDL